MAIADEWVPFATGSGACAMSSRRRRSSVLSVMPDSVGAAAG